MKLNLIPFLVLAVLMSTARLYAQTISSAIPDNGTGDLSPYYDQTTTTFNLTFSTALDLITNDKVSIVTNDGTNVMSNFIFTHLRSDRSRADLTLNNNQNLEYGKTYTLALTNVNAPDGEPVTLRYTFSTISAEDARPTLNLDRSTPRTQVSAYQKTTVLAFDNSTPENGVKRGEQTGNETYEDENGDTQDKIKIYRIGNNNNETALTYGDDYTYGYVDGNLEIYWNIALGFNTQYEIRMNELISNETIPLTTGYGADNEITYTFTTTNNRPTISVVDSDSYKVCPNNLSTGDISFTINEGHVGNFHEHSRDQPGDPNYQDQETEQIVLRIRGLNGANGGSYEFVEGVVSASEGGDLSSYDFDNAVDLELASNNNAMRIMFHETYSENGNNPINVEVQDEISGNLSVRLRDDTELETGTFEVFVSRVEESFTGINEGDVIATFTVAGTDDTPTLQMTGSSPYCAGDEVTLRVQDNTDSNFLYFVTNGSEELIGENAVNRITGYTMTEGDTQFRIETTGTCPATSSIGPIVVNPIETPTIPNLVLYNGESNVGVNDDIVIHSDNVSLELENGGTLNNTNVGGIVSLTREGTSIDAAVRISGNKQYISIDPASPLTPETTYNVTIGAVRDVETPSCPDGAFSTTGNFTFTTGRLASISEELDGGNVCLSQALTLPDIVISERNASNFSILKTGAAPTQTINFRISEGFVLSSNLNTEASADLSANTDLASATINRTNDRNFSVTIQRQTPNSFNFWQTNHREHLDEITIRGVSISLANGTDPASSGDGAVWVTSSNNAFRGIDNFTVVARFGHIPTQQLTWESPDDDIRICEAGNIDFEVSINAVGEQGTMTLEWSKDNGTSTPINMSYNATSNLYTFLLSAGDLDGAGEYDFYATSSGTNDVCGTTIDTPKELTVPDVIPDREIVFQLKDRTEEDEYEVFNEKVRVHNQHDSLVIAAFHRIRTNNVSEPEPVYRYDPIEGEFYDEYSPNSPIIQHQGVQYWAARIQEHREDAPPLSLGTYNVRFEQECRGKILPPSQVMPAHFRIELYDARDSKQLDSEAISDGVICRNLRGKYVLNWVPETINSVELDSIIPIRDEFDGFIYKSIEEGQTDSSFFINADILEGQRATSLDINIKYSILGKDSTVIGTDSELQTLVIADHETAIEIIDQAEGDTLKPIYCEGDELDLVLLSTGSITYHQQYSIDSIVSLGTSSTLLFRDTTATDDLPEPGEDTDLAPSTLTIANFMKPRLEPYKLIATHTDENNCKKEINFDIVSSELPDPLDAIDDYYCVDDGEDGFIPELEVDVEELGTDSVYWYNSTGSRLLENPSLTLNSNISNATPSRTEFEIEVVNEARCVSARSNYNVSVGQRPTLDFNYQVANDHTRLWVEDQSELNNSLPDDQITNTFWVFNETNHPLVSEGESSYIEIEGGLQPVVLGVETSFGCQDSLTKYVTVPIRLDLADNESYIASFDDQSQSNWISTAQNDNVNSEVDEVRNSSWRWLPDTLGRQGVLYTAGDNEYSWIESPIINMTTWNAPMISIDLWYDMPEIEGVVLQYRTLGNTPSANSEWQTVGKVSLGNNWYTGESISAGPGGEISGWTGQSTNEAGNQWIQANYDLSFIRSIESAQFRIAYASFDLAGDTHRGGVAFDNFTISNKERKVFIEHYTNLKYPRFDEERQKVNAFVKERYDTEDPDIVYVQFHTPNGGPDTLNMMYTGERNSHHALREAPRRGLTFINQVQHEMGTFETDAVDLYGRETVQAPAFDLELSFDRENYQPGDYLQVSASAIRNSVPRITLDTAAKDLLNILQVAVVEKEIDYNGETHHNVLVELLPYFGKYNKWADWGRELGESIVIESEGWQIPVDAEPNRFALVAWIEKTRVNPYSSFNGIHMSREIFQAKQVDIDIPLFTSTPITSVKKLSSQGIKYYPIPIRDELHIELAEVTSPHTPWSVMTLTGQTVLKGNWQVSSQSQTIDMQALDRGIYLLQIEGYDKPIRISKN